MNIDGKQVEVLFASMGGEGRYEDWIYLEMLQREWERPVPDLDRYRHLRSDERPSARAVFVLLFWAYFETRIERIHREIMRTLPKRVLADALQRHSGIASRLEKLYSVFFDTTYWKDLRACGYSGIADLLEDIHKRRNAFTHGQPRAITDETVAALVEKLQIEHEAYIAVFNRRMKLAMTA